MLSERHAAFFVEPVHHAIGLDRQKSFEEQERLKIRRHRRIALVHRRQIRTHFIAQRRFVRERLIEHLPDLHRADIVVPEFLCKVISQRFFQPLVVEDRRVNEARERRLSRRRADSLLPQVGPHRVADRELFRNNGHRALVHGNHLITDGHLPRAYQACITPG
jgi:hypothetical protein